MDDSPLVPWIAVIALLAAAAALIGDRPQGPAAAPEAQAAPPEPLPSPPAPTSEPQAPEPPDAAPSAALQEERLVIRLEERAVWRSRSRTAPTLNVSRFWPAPGEAPLPDRELSAALEEVLALEEDMETALLPEAREALFALADEERLGAGAGEGPGAGLDAGPGEGSGAGPGGEEGPGAARPRVDPWEALLALEIDRRRQEADWLVRRADPDWRKASARSLALADAVSLANEGTLAGDIAELYALRALADRTADTYDPARAADAALNLLHFTDDFAVMEAAADLLSGVEGLDALSRSDVALLAGVHREVEDPRIRDGLGQLLLDQAIQRADPELAGALVHDLEAITAPTCPPDDDSPVCARRREDLAGADGLIAALGGPEPTRWRAALAAAAWRCHLAGAASEQPIVGRARWNGGFAGAWVWESWSPEGAEELTTCIERRTLAAPGPEAPTALTLEVLPPG